MYGRYVAAAAVLLGVTVVAPRVHLPHEPRDILFGDLDRTTIEEASDGTVTFRVHGGGESWWVSAERAPRCGVGQLFFAEGDAMHEARLFAARGYVGCAHVDYSWSR
jgi:hypothetical protein